LVFGFLWKTLVFGLWVSLWILVLLRFCWFFGPGVGFTKDSLLLGCRRLVLLRFRCFLGPGGWFYQGFVAFGVPEVGFTKVSLLFGSRVKTKNQKPMFSTKAQKPKTKNHIPKIGF
jgi:hypothetical protein